VHLAADRQKAAAVRSVAEWVIKITCMRESWIHYMGAIDVSDWLFSEPKFRFDVR
jgi:hypothetical protein